MVFADFTTHRRADVHNMRKTLNRMELFDLYRTKLAYFAEIVSSQIDQHIVFGQFFFVGKQLCFKRFVFLCGSASRSCPCKRESVQHTIFQLYQSFGRCPCNLYVCS